jgi:surface antigen
MRIAAIAGVFAFVTFFATSISTVSAESLDILKPNKTETMQLASSRVVQPMALLASIQTDIKPQPAATPAPIVHQVTAGESLSTIATQHHITWVRLFNKNQHIAHPDMLNVGENITIPTPEEQLADRPLPVAPQAPSVRPAKQAVITTAAYTVSRGASSGNTYTAGYCTWYAKNMRPDLPNNLGNADTWVARAAAQGIPTGSVPRVGAIGQRGMHVVYVERVNPDGTIFISEMNREGLHTRSTRTVPASYFTYIY